MVRPGCCADRPVLPATSRRVIDPRMCHDAEELVGARPGDRPGSSVLGQFPEQPAGGHVVPARRHLRIDQDVGVDRTHASTPVHQVEELVAVENVHPGLLGGLPPWSFSTNCSRAFPRPPSAGLSRSLATA